MAMTPMEAPVGLRDGIPFIPDGVAAAAARLRHAFGPRAVEVAERWASGDHGDIRWIAVANHLRRQDPHAVAS